MKLKGIINRISLAGFILIILITAVLYLLDERYQDTEFIQKVRSGNLEYVRSSIQKDPDIVHQSSPLNHTTPLHEAAAYGQNSIILLLLKNGASIDAERDAGRTPLHMAVFHGHPETVELLVKHGADINHLAWRHNNTPLQVAVANEHYDVVKTLLRLKANTEIRDMNGDTALDEAQEKGLDKMVELLIGGAKEKAPNKSLVRDRR